MGFIKKILKYTIIGFILLVIVALIIPEEWLETDEQNVTSVQADNEEDKVEAMIEYFEIDRPTKSISEMDDVEYLEMFFEPIIMNAAKASTAIGRNYWEPTYINGLMKYNEAEEYLNIAIEYSENLEHNIKQIPTGQFSKKVQKRADDLKETLAEVVNQQKDLIKVTKKLLEKDKYTFEEFNEQLKKKGGKDHAKFVDKDLKKANDKLYDLVYDR